MAFGYQIALFAHLLGFAALLGGCLAQLRTEAAPEVNLAMLYGAWLELVSGLALVALLSLQAQPISFVEYAIKLVLTLFTVVLVAKNRKFRSIPGGVLVIIAALALINAGLGMFWS